MLIANAAGVPTSCIRARGHRTGQQTRRRKGGVGKRCDTEGSASVAGGGLENATEGGDHRAIGKGVRGKGQ